MKGEIRVSSGNNSKLIILKGDDGNDYSVIDNGWIEVFYDSQGSMVGGEYDLIADVCLEGSFSVDEIVPTGIEFYHLTDFVVDRISMSYEQGEWTIREW
ncbi:hypothetical protein Rhal01_03412 [Rubritalea halochordaticola]|uniref:Uncharacterized protein n=1 Tax=Rubritalea halochordaticola TaxID=714537 RepID=A0ABP9V3H8_9BACT